MTLSISVFGQHNTYSNLKMSNGDSLKVLIKDVENYKGVYYRFKNSGKTHFLEAHEITSHSSGHRNFISKKIKPTAYEYQELFGQEIRKSGYPSNRYLVIDTSQIIIEDYYLLEVLHEGKATLFRLNNFLGHDLYFLESTNGTIQEIPLDFYKIRLNTEESTLIDMSDPNYLYSNVRYDIQRPRNYIRVLEESLNDDSISQILLNYTFSEELLLSIISQYNGVSNITLSKKLNNSTPIKPKLSLGRPALGIIYTPSVNVNRNGEVSKSKSSNMGVSLFLYKHLPRNGKNMYLKYGISHLFLNEYIDSKIDYSSFLVGLDHYYSFSTTSLFLGWNTGLARYSSGNYSGFQLPIGLELGMGFELGHSRVRLSAGFSAIFKSMAVVSYNPLSLSWVF